MYNLIAIVLIIEYNKSNMEVFNMEYMTALEISKKWNISSRRVGVLYTEGRIIGAVKKGKMWLIPQDAIKPAEARRKGVSK